MFTDRDGSVALLACFACWQIHSRRVLLVIGRILGLLICLKALYNEVRLPDLCFHTLILLESSLHRHNRPHDRPPSLLLLSSAPLLPPQLLAPWHFYVSSHPCDGQTYLHHFFWTCYKLFELPRAISQYCEDWDFIRAF
jgi:hypothetical protein